MEFIQIIELRTSKVDELRAMQREWEQKTEGKRTLRRSIISRDRNDPNRYLVFAFFDSYESAMKNSELPETADFAQKTGALVDGEIRFSDLDVIEELS